MGGGRFLRGKRKRRRRGGLLRRLAGTGLQVAVLGLLVLGGWWVWHRLSDPQAFPLDEIEITGGERADVAAIAERLAPARGRNLLFLDLDPLRRAAEADPWVETATLRKQLSGALHVVLREKVPAAAAHVGERRLWIDPTGRPIDELQAGEQAPGPWLTGIDRVRTERLRAGVVALEEIRRLGRGFSEEVREIDLRDARRVVLRLRSGEELWLPVDRSPENLERWLHLRDRIARRVGPVRYADLRWNDQITVMPAGTGGGRGDGS